MSIGDVFALLWLLVHLKYASLTNLCLKMHRSYIILNAWQQEKGSDNRRESLNGEAIKERKGEGGSRRQRQ